MQSCPSVIPTTSFLLGLGSFDCKFQGLDSWCWFPGLVFLDLEAWFGTHRLVFLVCDPWLWTPGLDFWFGLLVLSSWSGAPHFSLLDINSWIWIPGLRFLMEDGCLGIPAFEFFVMESPLRCTQTQLQWSEGGE